MSDLQGFFRKSRRLDFAGGESPGLAPADDLFSSSRAKFCNAKRQPGRKKVVATRRLVFKSKRNHVSFPFFETEEDALSFPDEESNKVQSHVRDDDVDTDEEQMNQGVFRAFTNFLQGLKENELRRSGGRLRALRPRLSTGDRVERPFEEARPREEETTDELLSKTSKLTE